MMLLLALFVFLGSMTLFNAGGSVPQTGLGEVKRAPAAPSTARLMVKRVIPTTIVAGNGFKSSEVVRLTGVPVRQVRASARGTFTVRFRGDPCSSLTVTAFGSKGSRASVNYSQLNCPAP
jgi:hypothetical protein